MKKILIIDDEIHIVELLRFNLENNGYKVDYSYDGFDGYLKTKEFQPDLILLDWMLPNISGIELLKKIHSKGTTIIIVTHHINEIEYCDNVVFMNEGNIDFCGYRNEFIKRLIKSEEFHNLNLPVNFQIAYEHYKNKNFPNVDLYKAGHHGSKTSSNADFLSLIKPSICVASCSAGNSEYTNNYLNVFPTQDFVTRISKYTNQVFATSYGMDSKEKPLNGNVIVSCDGNSTAVACSNNVTLLKDTEWFNSKIYVKKDNTFTSGKAKKDYFTKDTEGVKEVPFRIWG